MIRLDTPGQNMTAIAIGRARLYFSYNTCIAAVDDKNGAGLVNPEARHGSPTTRGHLSKLQLKGFPDAPSEAAFETHAAALMGRAFQ